MHTAASVMRSRHKRLPLNRLFKYTIMAFLSRSNTKRIEIRVVCLRIRRRFFENGARPLSTGNVIPRGWPQGFFQHILRYYNHTSVTSFHHYAFRRLDVYDFDSFFFSGENYIIITSKSSSITTIVL